MVALRVKIHTWRVSSFMFSNRRLAMPPIDVGVMEHATLFLRAEGGG